MKRKTQGLEEEGNAGELDSLACNLCSPQYCKSRLAQ